MAGNSGPIVGVLALQGDVREHSTVLRELGSDVREVRKPSDLVGIEGLVIPGGESSAVDKLIGVCNLRSSLEQAISGGMPVLGTCAGLILLASEIEDAAKGQKSLGGLDISVRRNALGPQIESFEGSLDVVGIPGPSMNVAFIRAPIISRVGDSVDVIAMLGEDQVVGVKSKNLIGVSFHPEITGEDRLHRFFLEQVRTSEFSYSGSMSL